jgi:hypothetical protein
MKATLPTGETARDWILANLLGAGGQYTHRTASEYLTAHLGQEVSTSMVRSVWVMAGKSAPPEVAMKGRPVEDDEPEIKGLTAEDLSDATSVWEKAIQIQQDTEGIGEKRKEQEIKWNSGPRCIVFMSDIHFGAGGVDYLAAQRDAQTIRDTPGMYGIYHGDGMENFVVPKLAHLNRDQPLSHEESLKLHKDWLDTMGKKLVAVVPGNHDLWSHKLVGIDYVRAHLGNHRCLYHKYDVAFDLRIGAARWIMQVRHKWRFNSVFNATHGLQVGWERGDVDYDIAVGGHTHIGTFFNDFWRHGKRRTAVLTGTYKSLYDPFGEEIGFPHSKDSGCGAIIFYEDGTFDVFRSAQRAASYMAYLRGGFPA